MGLLGDYAAVTLLSFPHPLAGRVIDLGIALAWLGPALLILGISGLPPLRAARFGFVAGLAAHAAILHWIYVVTVRYGHAPAVVGLLAPAALAAYIALFTSAFGGAFAWLERRGAANAFTAAALWAALDHLRSFAFSGFPWATLGYAQHQNVALLGVAAWTGVYGLSFATALGGAALADGVRAARARRAPARSALAAVAVVALLHAAGAARQALDRPAPAGTLRVGVLQGNIDQGRKWDVQRLTETLEIYEQLAGRAASQGAEVIVWPETALPVDLGRTPGLRRRLAALARQRGVAMVVGAVGVEGEGAAGPTRYYDSAFLVDAGGRFAGRYDKAHLVPFGEYVPLRDLLGAVLSGIARGIAPDNVTPGDGPRPFSLEVPGPDGVPGRTLTAGVPICYELLFPDLVRRFVGRGASVLFAITNDAWYGRTGAPYQFLAITAVRSAETGVWTARAANTGVSAFIDDRGRVRRSTRIFERGLLVEDVPLRPPRAGGTFYVRHGDVFAAGCWAGLFAAALAGAWKARQERGR